MKISSKPGPLTAPLPVVMVTCGDMENSNIITVAWTGIINSHPPMTYISVRPERKSHAMIEQSGEFVINLTTADLARAMDFCGVRSGRDTDKFSRLSLTREPADTVSAPMIAESPVNIECKVTEVKRFPSHDMFIAEITAYYRLKKEELGFFGYSIMKPKTARKRKARSKKLSRSDRGDTWKYDSKDQRIV